MYQYVCHENVSVYEKDKGVCFVLPAVVDTSCSLQVVELGDLGDVV